MRCECDAHSGWADDFPELHQVEKRIDPGDGRTEVVWCLACFEYVTEQWENYAATLADDMRTAYGF